VIRMIRTFHPNYRALPRPFTLRCVEQALRSAGTVSGKQLAERSGFSAHTVLRALRRLALEERVERVSPYKWRSVRDGSQGR
jgi:DNA-binding GntR family transcriptional regulator